MPAATKFLLHFNESEFNIQVRASNYYSFLILTLIALGFVFQIPMGIVALTRLGIMTPRQLSQNRRYAYLILAIVAMLLPGTDPVTMLIELAPLLALFELSLILARFLGTPSDRARRGAEPEPPGQPRELGSRGALRSPGQAKARSCRWSTASLALIFLVGFVGFSIGSGNAPGGLPDAIGLAERRLGGSTQHPVRRPDQRRERAAGKHPNDPTRPAEAGQVRVLQGQAGGPPGSDHRPGLGQPGRPHRAGPFRRRVGEVPEGEQGQARRRRRGLHGPGVLPAQRRVRRSQGAGFVAEKTPSAGPTASSPSTSTPASTSRAGDAAAKKAESLAPKAQRKQISSQLGAIRKQAVKIKKQQAKAQKNAPPATTPGANPLQNPFGGVGRPVAATGASLPSPPPGR